MTEYEHEDVIDCYNFSKFVRINGIFIFKNQWHLHIYFEFSLYNHLIINDNKIELKDNMDDSVQWKNGLHLY